MATSFTEKNNYFTYLSLEKQSEMLTTRWRFV